MEVYVIGINYSQTPPVIREKLATGIGRLEDALLSLRTYVAEGVIVATCNRTEIYTSDDENSQVNSAATNFLKAVTELSDAELLPHIYFYQGKEAIKHLFCVASGLDSMIIGEFEVLGQLNRAIEEAEERGLVGLALRKLFHHAIGVGRRVRTETGISRSALSVSSVAVEMAAKVIGDVDQSKVLVIGAGEAGRLVAKAAKERGAAQVSIATRNQEKASAIAAMLNGRPVHMKDLDEELTTTDIVISCTAAPHFILKYPRVVQIMKARPERPLAIIDIAVPRDVEPEVGQIDNVSLYDIDDFTKIAEINRRQRQQEIQQATELIDDEVERFSYWWQTLEARPTISALIKKMENIRQVQFARTVKKLPNLSDEERASLEAMTKSIVQKVLHEPIRHLKESQDKEAYIRLVKKLFGLDSGQGK